jgi:hypothetical protein
LADWQSDGDRSERWRARLDIPGSHNLVAEPLTATLIASLAVVALSQYVQHSYAADLLDSGDGYLPRTEWLTWRSSSPRCAAWPSAEPSSTRRP